MRFVYLMCCVFVACGADLANTVLCVPRKVGLSWRRDDLRMNSLLRQRPVLVSFFIASFVNSPLHAPLDCSGQCARQKCTSRTVRGIRTNCVDQVTACQVATHSTPPSHLVDCL